MRKKGVSPVIATILLILIAVSAVAIVFQVIIPMVKENLEEGKSCFELRDYIEVESSNQYSCYNNDETRLMISRGVKDYSIEGIAVSLFLEGESNRYDIKEGADSIEMLDYSNVIIPSPGEARTYVFPVTATRAEIAVIIDEDNVCNSLSYNIPPCNLENE